ncbi:MAG: SIMPL domain-containing protein, partial [Patescibacteria group bacterium]
MANKWDSKTIFSILLNVVLVVAVLLGLVWAKYLYRQSAAFQPARTISVSADGKTVVSPDIAKISFSVVSEGADPEKLVAENTAKMNKAIDFVKAQGVEAKDIKTTNYNLSP